MKAAMVVRAVGSKLRLAAGLALACCVAVSACSSDAPRSAPASDAATSDAGASDVGAGGEAGAPISGEAGAPGNGEAGMKPVAPGDLVCQTDSDCHGDKHVCDPVQGCVACLHDWDCPANDRCEANQCFAKLACKDSSDCAHTAAQPVCDAVQKVCVGCRVDGDCAMGQRCGSSKCEAVQACANSHDCQNGEVCERVTGVCVACVVDGDCGQGNACVANACVPNCKSDKECLGIGLLCDLTLGRCVECVSNADCPGNYFCGISGVCQPDVCNSGDARCQDTHTLGTCSPAGDGFLNSTCASDQACDEQSTTSAACEPLVCAPGSVVCSADGQSVVTCSADGLSVKSTDVCGAGQACVAAACQDVVCPPATFLCDSSDVYQCDATGTVKTKITTCTKNATCNANSGSCTPPNCTAGAALCDGNSATTCADDGTGPLPGGTPCGDGQACYLGQCKPQVCSGAYQCTDAALFKCANNGTVAQLQSTCGAPGLCDAVAAKCLTPKCTPGAFTCDGSVATRCKSDGSGFEAGGTDCSAQSLVCDGGGCLPQVCTPASSFCQGGNPQLCSATGATYGPSDACLTSEYCSTGSKFCLTDKCTAGSAVCNANLATTCAADGSGPVDGGTDCSLAGQICVAGACKPVVCTKGSLACQGEAVYVCNATGTGTTLYQACLTSQFCDASAEVATCTADVCNAGSLGCSQEVVSTCGSNGGSWTNPGTNCAASSQVCVLGGSCAAQEVTVQGSAQSAAAYVSTTQLAGFRVTTARKLSQLEVYASVAGVQKFSWVVYQKRAGSSAFDLVYQKVTAQATTAAGFVSSGALTYTLAAGKTYAVGVHITGTASVSYLYASPGIGLAQGGFIAAPFAATYSDGVQPSASVTPYMDPYYKSYIRCTTALP